MDGEETQQLQGQVAGDRVPASVDALVDSWQMLPAAPNKCHDTTGCPKPLKLWRAEVTHFPCGHQVQERCVCVSVCVWGQPLFRRAFITCPIFCYSSQFTSRGTRHP